MKKKLKEKKTLPKPKSPLVYRRKLTDDTEEEISYKEMAWELRRKELEIDKLRVDVGNIARENASLRGSNEILSTLVDRLYTTVKQLATDYGNMDFMGNKIADHLIASATKRDSMGF